MRLDRQSQGWTCTQAPSTEFTCTLPANQLAPGATRYVEVLIETADLTADFNSGFRNCAKLSAANGGREYCADGGTPQIVVEKTAPAFCQPGQPCTFQVTVSNTGDSAYSGPVSITDAMNGGPAVIPVASIVPPLPCASQPTQAPFKFSSGTSPGVMISSMQRAMCLSPRPTCRP